MADYRWTNDFMIRSYKGVTPQIPETCYIDDSAQIIGDVQFGEHASVWMNAVLRGDVHAIRIGTGVSARDHPIQSRQPARFGVGGNTEYRPHLDRRFERKSPHTFGRTAVGSQ